MAFGAKNKLKDYIPNATYTTIMIQELNYKIQHQEHSPIVQFIIIQQLELKLQEMQHP